MEVKLEIGRSDYNDLVAYCSLNNLDIKDIIKKSYLEGFRIEKYGLLNPKSEVKEIVKEVIKTVEVPVEVIKEIPKIEYVEIEKPIEKIVEIIKEVPKVEYVEVIKEVLSPPKEVEVIKYVDREVIKEVFIEKDVSNNDNFYDKKYVDELKEKILELQNKPPEIKEIPVEVIKEVIVEKEIPIEVIKEVIVEKISPIETIKEIIVEKYDDTLKVKLEALQQTVMKLKQENIDKSDTISELKKKLEENRLYEEAKPAVYLRGSNLNNKLLK